jgi:hypothetical protein
MDAISFVLGVRAQQLRAEKAKTLINGYEYDTHKTTTARESQEQDSFLFTNARAFFAAGLVMLPKRRMCAPSTRQRKMRMSFISIGGVSHESCWHVHSNQEDSLVETPC